MNGVYISFYLKANRVHIFVEALRSMGSPGRIRFLISKDGRILLIQPYGKSQSVFCELCCEVYALPNITCVPFSVPDSVL